MLHRLSFRNRGSKSPAEKVAWSYQAQEWLLWLMRMSSDETKPSSPKTNQQQCNVDIPLLAQPQTTLKFNLNRAPQPRANGGVVADCTSRSLTLFFPQSSAEMGFARTFLIQFPSNPNIYFWGYWLLPINRHLSAPCVSGQKWRWNFWTKYGGLKSVSLHFHLTSIVTQNEFQQRSYFPSI